MQNRTSLRTNRITTDVPINQINDERSTCSTYGYGLLSSPTCQPAVCINWAGYVVLWIDAVEHVHLREPEDTARVLET